MNTLISPGKSFPLGATVYSSGVNFSVFAKGSTAAQLLLFNQADDAYPSRTVTLDPVTNRSRHYWHIFVPGLGVGQIYGYQVDGSLAPEQGLRFDPRKVFESRPWRRCLDTFLEPPDDICTFSKAPPVTGSSYLVNPRSIVALARIADDHPGAIY